MPPGAPIECSCTATKIRRGRSRHFVRYDFRFVHQGEVCYAGDQSAVWSRVAES